MTRTLRSDLTRCGWRRARKLVALAAWLAAAASLALPAADWPTYRADAARSGVSPERLALPLAPLWTFKSPHAPQPAWSGEAKADLYNKVYDLSHRQAFDRCFDVVAADGRVWFGSSADDQVRCLDATSGEQRWSFFAEGPVRLAPAWDQGRLYAGSDDGLVYCLTANEGELIWKTRLGPRDYRIPGNRRVISAWPVRTSVVVRDGVAYACGGMFPSEGVYVCALEAKTGVIKWQTVQRDLPAQGYLLASADRLYVPAGRDNPVVFERATGKRLRVVEGAGGTYALLTGDGLVFGPGKSGQLGLVPGETSDQLATFQGNHMIVTPGVSYLHSETELSALNRARYIELARQKSALATRRADLNKRLKQAEKNRDETDRAKLKDEFVKLGEEMDRLAREMGECVLWKRPCAQPYCLILAGETLLAGGRSEVAALSGTDGKPVWQGAVTGRAFGLAVAAGRLFVSTDSGTIHCFGAPAQRSQGRVAPPASSVPTPPATVN
jgi:outer membrane protein assembly factor BamB